MSRLKENNAKYIYLIVFILIQLFGYTNSADPIACVQCGGSNKNECSDKLTEAPTNCTDDTFKKCYTQIDTNGKIERGCRKPDDESTCKSENNCIITEAEKNNQLICKKCEGSDEKCFQVDMNANDVKYNQICDAGTKKCLIKIDNQHVVRGCASDSDITQCTNATICKTCDGVNCNTGAIFPDALLSCYQCNGNSCNDVTSVSPKPCAIYVEKDECYSKGESDTTMIRGCKSDTKDNKCSSSAEGCAFCSDSNCNKLKYKRVQELKCYQCSSNNTTTNDDCFEKQTDTNFKNCAQDILYNQPEYCYTQVENGTIKRGCLHDNAKLTIDKCIDGDGNTCNVCNSPNGCNSKSIEFTCIRCRSDIEQKCWNEANKLTGEKCRHDSSSTDGCFQGIWHGVTIRGCVADASIQDQVICNDEKDLQCNVCHKKDCNTLISSSSAAKISFSCGLLLIVFITLRKFK